MTLRMDAPALSSRRLEAKDMSSRTPTVPLYRNEVRKCAQLAMQHVCF